MADHRWGSAVVLAVAIALTATAIAMLYAPGRKGEPEPGTLLAAQEAAGGDLEFSPDTMIGWDRGPRQPILFSHRRHAGVYGIECLYCHSNTDRSPYAYIPSVQLCMGCHQVVKSGSPEIQTLRGYQERGEPVPWVRIYRLADFVQFNHAPHIRADLECQECHGPVETMDVVYRAAPLTMGWCLECHWQPADSAKLAGARAVERRFRFEGREERGLYPRSIDSDYGVTRAPIDCAICHY